MKNQSTIINLQLSGRNFSKSIVVEKNQRVNLSTESVYDAPRQIGEVVVKAVVMENGFLDLSGIIKIKKRANLAQAFLRQKVLLVGENSRAEARPELEIETDEVKASHAASVGRIDEEEIFYLMSRGLSRSEAIELIVKAFLGEENEK
jgi:Fe-S cluster assembly protein SufD